MPGEDRRPATASAGPTGAVRADDHVAAGPSTEARAVHPVVDDLADRILGPRRYTADEVGAAVGISVDDIDPLWMELGFAPVERDRTMFTDMDVEALRLLVTAQRAGLLGDDVAVALARVLGQALARVSATYAQLLAPAIATFSSEPSSDVPVSVSLSGGASIGSLQELTDTIVDWVVPTMDRFVEYSWRRHLLTALDRHLQPRTSEVVGFADLVGYTRLSATMDPQGIPDLVSRFQELATRHLVVHGGRVVKTIGDAVLFTFPDGASAATGALELVRACADDPALPDACAGLACGLVSEVEGDLYGDTVNRAARLVELAHPGAVLADEDTALQVIDLDWLHLRQLRPRRLKGLGYVRTWVLRAASGPGA